MKSLKELEKEYKEQAEKRKAKIKALNSGFKRFWGWVWYFITFPFVWLFYNIRDWRSAICVIISFLLWSASVWVWYLLAFITGWTTDAAKWFIGVGSAIWVWWLSPIGSPFILLVSFTAIGMKMLFNKIKNHKKKNKEKTESEKDANTDIKE